MKTNVTEKYNCVVIELKGNVMGGPSTEDFSKLLHSLVDDGKTNVVVDLGKVKFMNSSGLGMLIGGFTTLKKAGGDLRICRADNKIESLLVVTKLITVFKHFKTLDEAVKSYD
jgi:anti-sigma B factor antagonist